ncbi:BQ5605_C007g04746 [Microbotryum silenes-dioicae]|uniref:BQ5605_C007g04746 protein n=1 Tax=Microbotryum silenes-dioicae TaxID=796604 RepID=A0A2X0MAZ5_9BASI|nr:BQ5605_C007g04746 [Microbotryum silenes-dioicae]
MTTLVWTDEPVMASFQTPGHSSIYFNLDIVHYTFLHASRAGPPDLYLVYRAF